MTDTHQTPTPNWLVSGVEDEGLRRYVETIRERWKLIAGCVLVTTLFAILYVALAPKTYEAKATLLVTPVSRDSDAFSNLGLIRDSNDPTRDVQTAAQLATNTDVAKVAAQKLGSKESAKQLLSHIAANPVANSNIVQITAKASKPEEAQRLANAFAEAVVVDRTSKLHGQLDVVLTSLKKRLQSTSDPATRDAIKNQISLLETLRAGSDPTIRFDTRADKPDSPSWPKPTLSILAGILAGLVLGIGAAFAAQTLDPRLRREEQLRALYRLPVLARIPAQKRPPGGGVIAPQQLAPANVEAFRTLRATISAALKSRQDVQTIMITGASPSEGKTTTAVNLAASYALGGKRVILIEADIRKPKIGQALKVSSSRGIASVLIDEMPLSKALVDAPGYRGLELLLVDRGGEWMADQFSLPAARTLVEEAKQLADVVIIDSPPLTEVTDALPLLQMADGVVMIARIGTTHLKKLTRLGELLTQQGIIPIGLAVVGVSASNEYGYYGSGVQDQVTNLRDLGERPEPAVSE